MNTTDAQLELTLTFTDKNELYLAYMPFIKGGGLFLRTKKTIEMGQEIQAQVKLIDEQDHYTIYGTVVWVTPKCAQGNREAGIGIQLQATAQMEAFRHKIEAYLAGMLTSERRTDTL